MSLDGTGAGYCVRSQFWSLLSMGLENFLGARALRNFVFLSACGDDLERSSAEVVPRLND